MPFLPNHKTSTTNKRHLGEMSGTTKGQRYRMKRITVDGGKNTGKATALEFTTKRMCFRLGYWQRIGKGNGIFKIIKRNQVYPFDLDGWEIRIWRVSFAWITKEDDMIRKERRTGL